MAIAYQKVLLTGGSGYVGRKFLERLPHRTDMIVDRLGRSVHDDIQWHLVGKDDLVDVEVVYHLAGSTDLFSLRDDAEAHRRANVQLTETLFKLFLESDAKLFVYMSTAKVMGESRSEPYQLDEMPNPESVYAKSKLDAEQCILRLWADFKNAQPLSNKQFVILRPTMIYGGQRKGTLWSLLRWINKGLPVLDAWMSVRRSMVHVESVLDILEAIPSTQNLLPCYFLADSPTLTLGEIFETMTARKNAQLKRLRFLGFLRKPLLFLDQAFFDGKLAWQLNKLEKDFIVDEKGVFQLKDSEAVKFSLVRLAECIGEFEEKSK